MRKLWVLFAVFLLAGICVQAQPSERPMLSVNVPFSFTVNSTTLPAGMYNVYRLELDSLKLESADRKRTVIMHCAPAYRAAIFEQGKLAFRVVGGEHFLSEVEEPSSNVAQQFPVGNREQMLARLGNKRQPAAVSAFAAE